jgi:hypothetical protein
MPNCGCAGNVCSCLIVSGTGIQISGTGTSANPYIVNSTSSSITGMLRVSDTPSLDMSMSGVGSDADPYNISGVVALRLTQLVDVNDPAGPVTGDVPVWVAAAGPVAAHWEFQQPPTTPPGAVTVGSGLVGDGSGGNAISIRTSGTWGAGPLAGYGATSTIGAPVYVDSAGQVRSQPHGFEQVADGVRPTQYLGRAIVESGTKALYYSDGATWRAIGTSAIDASQVVSGVFDVARIPNLPAGKIVGGTLDPSLIGSIPASSLTGTVPIAQGGTGATTAAAARSALGIAANVVPTAGSNVQTDLDYLSGKAGQAQTTANDAYNIANNAYNTAVIRALNWGGNAEQVRYAHGPTSAAYGRQAGANRFAVWMDSGLEFGQATSSRRYKDHIRDWDIDVAALLRVRPQVFHRLVDADHVMDYGAVAEDLDNEGLTELVFYDDQGRPDSIPEHRVVWALLGLVQHLAGRVEALEGKQPAS